VQFRCPHCSQTYYGTTPQGHLEPIEFGCAGCGKHLHMDQMVILPAEGVDEQQTRLDVNPWLDRQSQGWLKGWIKTIGRGMVFPSPLIRATPLDSSTGQAWLFVVLTNTIYHVVGALGYLLFMTVFFGVMGMWGGFGGGMAPMQMIGFQLIGCTGASLALVVLTVVVFALWGPVTHGILRLGGGRTQAGIGRTYQALAYPSGANFFVSIPCMGYYLIWAGWVWWSICAIFTVRDGQRVSGARAAMAVLPVPVCGMLVLVGLIVAYVIAIQSMMAAVRAATPTMPAASNASLVAAAVSDYAELNNGQGPRHAAQLLANDNLSADDLIAVQAITFKKDVPVGDATLEQFEGRSNEQQQAAVQAALDALPDDAVAHRLGDFVFVHHGLDFSNIDGNLWVVILSPDPDAGNAPPAPYEQIAVGTMDGGSQSITAADFQSKLREQNALRAQHNLPPIPDPRQVTHDKPARAGDSADPPPADDDDADQ
jgi:hypothetical protein